jgi:phosphoribosylanthranilate isomerase
MKHPVKVKICGITRLEDAMAAIEAGADALGFNFFKGSPRCVFPETVKDIISKLPPFITTVGVFVNETAETINEILDITGIDAIQLHGDESPDFCTLWSKVIKAFRVRDLTDLEPLKRYRATAFLLDTYSKDSYGGTGQIFNWDIAREAKRFGPIILAGGLTPGNVEDAVRIVRPYAVDVCSGIEKEKGIKDAERMKLFIERAKTALQKH